MYAHREVRMAGEDMRYMLLALPKVLLVDYTHYTLLTDDVQRLEGYSVIHDIVIGRCIVISTASTQQVSLISPSPSNVKP